jgi:hypothetical protein
MTPPPVTFERACQDAVNELRAALVELYDSVDADPLSPQDVARRFRLNKTLTWNVSRLIQAPDGLAAVTHVPGKAAIEKMLEATRRDGASDRAIANVRSATSAFEHVVEVHLGDRGTLDLVLDAISTPTSDGLERSRKLAFRGNSGLYGVQAKTKLITGFLCPNPDDATRIDMAMISGYCGFRRLRSSVRWPIFMPRAWASAEEPIEQRWNSIDESQNGAFSGLSLISKFSQGSLPEMEVAETDEGMNIMLKPGAIGNPGAFDCFRGDFMRSAAGRYRTELDRTGEIGASITTPAEFLVIDLIAHEELDFALQPDVLVYGRFYSHGEAVGGDEEMRLPIRQKVSSLPGSPPAVATSLVPHYAEIVRMVYERLDWTPSEFRGVRLQMPYPPFGSTVVLQFKLPEPPR